MAYKGTDDEEDLLNFQMHSISQCGAYKPAGLLGVDECVQGWINSKVWHEPALRDPTGIYGAVAFYTYNSATTGVTWSTAIYTIWSRDEETPTHAEEIIWPTILNCETNSTIIK